jgi:hypothetical protein
MKKLTLTHVVQVDRPVMQTYPVIPPTREIIKSLALLDQSEKFKLFGTGNEKRDLVLLLRGDIRLLQNADTSFFGCLNCGHTSRSPHFRGTRDNSKAYCSQCDTEDMIYSFDGVYKNVHARIQVGYNDTTVKIQKL